MLMIYGVFEFVAVSIESIYCRITITVTIVDIIIAVILYSLRPMTYVFCLETTEILEAI